MRWSWAGLVVALLSCTLDEGETSAAKGLDGIEASADASVLEMDPRAMDALEDDGLSLSRLFGARTRTNDALAQTDLWSTLLTTVDADLLELALRPELRETQPFRLFRPEWLRDQRARFELIAAVNRLDRDFLDPSACGEARLVYRLVLEPEGRPPTQLPMTVSVVFPQPKTRHGVFGQPSCVNVAKAWMDLPRDGAARVRALRALYAGLPDFDKVEINLQNFHGATMGIVESLGGGRGYDDHAEYLLRSFDRVGNALVPRVLVDTPRDDLDANAKRDLAAWIREHFDDVDRGSWVVPDRFLAKRAISVTPRGFVRPRNRPFLRLFSDDAAFADLPYARGQLVKSPAGLLRRLDQGTCVGCHETRSVAGFHLLGESRDADARLNAVAVPRSTHVDIELGWRAALTAATARGASFDTPRPFAERKKAGPGRVGAHCAVNADPTFAGWTCAPGLTCHPVAHEDVGFCMATSARGNAVGEACEDDILLGPDVDANGPIVEPQSAAACTFGGRPGTCDPTLLGFPGGLCVANCATAGTITEGGHLLCGELPTSGYENDCFGSEEPIERCLTRHLIKRVLRTCDADNACRDDLACARMPGLPPKTGACVPTYFVFGLRVDGPMTDR